MSRGFRGFFQTTIDAKGRTSLPARFREVLVEKYQDERFVITNSSPVKLEEGVKRCGLAIYPYNDFCAIEEKLENGSGLGLTSEQLDRMRRLIITPADDGVADKLGRMMIPPHLRKNAALEREIVFVGLGNKIQIWNLGDYEKLFAQDIEHFPSTEALAELGL